VKAQSKPRGSPPRNERRDNLRLGRAPSGWRHPPFHHAWLFAAFFAALVAWRFEVVFSPPYYETALGLFREADFLAETNFDYRRLRFDEAVGNDGGPYVYMTSVLPSLLAVLMKLAPSASWVLVLSHLLWFAAAAWIAVLVVELVRPSTGWAFAIATGAAVVTTPLVAVQAEILSLDVMMAAGVLATALAVSRGRYVMAAFFSTAAFFMKPTGTLATMATIAYLGLVLIVKLVTSGLRPGLAATRELRRGLAANLAALGLQVGVYYLGGVHARLRRIGSNEGLLANATYICPDLLLVLAACLAGGAALGLVALHRRQRGSHGTMLGAARALLHSLDARPTIWFSLILSAGLLAAIAFYSRVLVIRYLVLGVPLLWVIAAAVFSRPSWGRWCAIIPCAMVVVNLLNAGGRWFPAPPAPTRHCSVLERSREYLVDHESTIHGIHKLLDDWHGEPIVAGYPFNYLLSFPRLGVVDRPLEGYACMPITGTRFRPISALLRDKPTKLVIFSVANPSHRIGWVTTPLPENGDEVIYNDGLDPPLVIFRKDLSRLAHNEKALENWYVDNFWAGRQHQPLPASVIHRRVLDLQGLGRLDLAARLLRQSADRQPAALSLRLELAEILVILGRPHESIRESASVLARVTSRAAWRNREAYAYATYLVGLAVLQQGNIEAAAGRFEEALLNDPNHVEAHFQLGVCRLQQPGRSQEAVRHFNTVLDLRPEHVEARYHLGLAHLREGRREEAIAAMRQTLTLAPNHAGASSVLAQALPVRP